MPLHIYGAEGSGRAEVLARTATDAAFNIYRRYFGRIGIVSLKRHHSDCAYRTVTGTVAALHTVSHGHTVSLNPHCMTYLCTGFFIRGDRPDGARRAHFRAFRSLGSARSALI